jgi:hypothetical protein
MRTQTVPITKDPVGLEAAAAQLEYVGFPKIMAIGWRSAGKALFGIHATRPPDTKPLARRSVQLIMNPVYEPNTRLVRT